MANLVTRMTPELYTRIVDHLVRSDLTPVRWIAKIARDREPRPRVVSARGVMRHPSTGNLVTLIAFVPDAVKARLKFWGLPEAEWVRAVINEHLSGRPPASKQAAARRRP